MTKGITLPLVVAVVLRNRSIDRMTTFLRVPNSKRTKKRMLTIASEIEGILWDRDSSRPV